MKNVTQKMLSLLVIGLATQVSFLAQAQAAKVFTINSPRMPGITRMRFADVRTGMIDSTGKKLNHVAFVRPEFEFQGKFLKLGWNGKTRVVIPSMSDWLVQNKPAADVLPVSRAAEVLCESYNLHLVNFRTELAQPDERLFDSKILPEPSLMIEAPTANFPMVEDNYVVVLGEIVSVVVCEK